MIDVEIYIDVKEQKGIMGIITSERNKFKRILYYILQGKYNEDLYGKEVVTPKCKDITAMKFKGAINTRIYCKEIHVSTKKKIIAIHLLRNKSFQSAGHKSLKPKLESISQYDYEFHD